MMSFFRNHFIAVFINFLRLSLPVFFTLIGANQASSQGLQSTGGSDTVQSGQVSVVQEFKPITANAIKVMPVPLIKDSLPSPVKFEYQFTDHVVRVPFLPPAISLPKLKGEPLSVLRRGSMKLGFGLYTSPFAEISIGSLRSKKYFYSLNASHFSSWGKYGGYPNPVFSDHDLNLKAFTFIPNHKLSAEVDYYHHRFQYYGGINPLEIPAEIVAGRQFYSLYSGKLQFEKLDKRKADNLFSYATNLGYYQIFDRYNNRESSISISGHVGKKIVTEFIGAKVNMDYYNTKTTGANFSDVILQFAPFVKIQKTRWEGSMGLNITHENLASSTYFYPDMNIRYEVVKDWLSMKAEVTGGLQRNGVKSISEQNPFVYYSSDFRFANTSNQIRAALSLQGRINKKLYYSASADYFQFSNHLFFVNQIYTADTVQNHFVASYGNMKEVRLRGEMSQLVNADFKLAVFGTYHHYFDLMEQAQPWQLPRWEAGLRSSWNPSANLSLKLDFLYIGNRFAAMTEYSSLDVPPTVLQRKSFNLPGVPDLNLAVEYRVSEALFAYCQVANILSRKYYLWAHYPLQRFNAQAGIRILF